MNAIIGHYNVFFTYCRPSLSFRNKFFSFFRFAVVCLTSGQDVVFLYVQIPNHRGYHQDGFLSEANNYLFKKEKTTKKA